MEQQVNSCRIHYTNVQEVSVPAGARLLTVEKEEGELRLVYLAQADAPPENRKIRMLWVGETCPAGEFLVLIDKVRVRDSLLLVFEDIAGEIDYIESK